MHGSTDGKIESANVNNYEFCADFARRAANGRPDFKALDYGCGAGEIVAAMRCNGLEAFGCEAFYEGGDTSQSVPDAIRDRVLRMEGDRIPFPDATFDLVVTNQVLEHVADLDIALGEIARVLKPGASCLAMFPHLEVWREGHCEMPFVHRMPRAIRIPYAAALRAIGLGVNRDDLSPIAWARNFFDWRDRWCHYRPLATIRETFRNHLSEPQHIEAAWVAARSERLAKLPAIFRTMIARKAAGLVLVAVKSPRG